ncbi:hypothetical protein ABBQ38_010392 [Trebouxia sp. C0009 RCD-2024]
MVFDSHDDMWHWTARQVAYIDVKEVQSKKGSLHTRHPKSYTLYSHGQSASQSSETHHSTPRPGAEDGQNGADGNSPGWNRIQ